jgi:hypothetical protein
MPYRVDLHSSKNINTLASQLLYNSLVIQNWHLQIMAVFLSDQAGIPMAGDYK